MSIWGINFFESENAIYAFITALLALLTILGLLFKGFQWVYRLVKPTPPTINELERKAVVESHSTLNETVKKQNQEIEALSQRIKELTSQQERAELSTENKAELHRLLGEKEVLIAQRDRELAEQADRLAEKEQEAEAYKVAAEEKGALVERQGAELWGQRERIALLEAQIAQFIKETAARPTENPYTEDARALVKEQKLDQAIQTYDQAIAQEQVAYDQAEANTQARKQALAEAYFEKAKVHFMKFEWTQAEAAYQAALELEPNNSLFLNQLGELYWQLQRNQDAIGLFNQALEIDRQTLGEESEMVARGLNNLGNSWND